MSFEKQFIMSKWEARQGPPVLSTVDSTGCPNVIYFTAGGFYDPSTFYIADNYFLKTRGNVLAGCLASVLFLTPDRNSYQFKGPIRFEESGPVFEAMKFINPTNHPGRAAAVITITDIFSGSKRIL